MQRIYAINEGSMSIVTPPANETMHVNSRKVVCDGGEGPLGHPRVYLRILGSEIECPYCSRRFILESGATDAGH
jgi:uncharacterized Zn-finger protein